MSMWIQTTFESQDLEAQPLVGGLHLPGRFELTAGGEDLPYNVEAKVVLDRGRFVCERLTCSRADGRPVTTEGLREVPVGEIIRAAAESVLARLKELDDGDMEISLAQLPRTSSRLTDEVLEAVAAVYRLAHATGMPPVRALSRRFGIPRTTAARWVRVARRKGLLGPTDRGRAGEEHGDG